MSNFSFDELLLINVAFVNNGSLVYFYCGYIDQVLYFRPT